MTRYYDRDRQRQRERQALENAKVWLGICCVIASATAGWYLATLPNPKALATIAGSISGLLAGLTIGLLVTWFVLQAMPMEQPRSTSRQQPPLVIVAGGQAVQPHSYEARMAQMPSGPRQFQFVDKQPQPAALTVPQWSAEDVDDFDLPPAQPIRQPVAAPMQFDRTPAQPQPEQPETLSRAEEYYAVLKEMDWDPFNNTLTAACRTLDPCFNDVEIKPAGASYHDVKQALQWLKDDLSTSSTS
jgi:hypothetical protein